MSAANLLAAEYGLNLQIQGVTEDSGEVTAVSQSIDLQKVADSVRIK